jgi:uncharacterized protein YjbJ (UPF0337 family)
MKTSSGRRLRPTARTVGDPQPLHGWGSDKRSLGPISPNERVAFGTASATGTYRIASALIVRFSKEEIMDKEHVKGAADKAKGAVKDAAGKMMDDKKLQAEGKMDKAKGEARQALGDAKDSLKHVRNEH